MGVRVPPSALRTDRFALAVNRLLALFVGVALIGLASCTDDRGRADDTNQRLIDIYSAAIEQVVTYERPDLAIDEPLDIVVYVSPRGEVDIVLEVQLGVVIALEEWATIRFIDEFEEAIDGGQDHQPVRDGGVLVGLGEVSDGTTSARVVADRYEQAGELVSFDLTLQRSGGEWTVDEPVEGTYVNLR
jgi:hypothetical protein